MPTTQQDVWEQAIGQLDEAAAALDQAAATAKDAGGAWLTTPSGVGVRDLSRLAVALLAAWRAERGTL